MTRMTAQTGPDGEDAASSAEADALPAVPGWSLSRRARNAVRPVLPTVTFLLLLASPRGLAAEYPLVRILGIAAIVTGVVQVLGELRVRVLLERDGVVIARAVRRTRIPWAHVREVRVRGLDMGRGWVEVVRDDGRQVVLPAPVEAYNVLEEQWQRAIAAQSNPGTSGEDLGAKGVP